MMEINILSKIEKYYQEKNRLNGIGAPDNLWATPDRQIIRFEQITKALNLNNKNILDVGCGYGDFYNWLNNQNIIPRSYIGIDLVKEHCEVAQKNLPSNCSIIHGDFLKQNLPHVDYVILSGALNIYEEGWLELTYKILDKMWDLSILAMMFNLRSPWSIKGNYMNVKKHIDELSPSLWCSYAHTKTSKYALYHNYVDYDYSIAMWKSSI